MPKISEFYGIIVYMNFYDVHPHQLPHVHVQYQDEEASLSVMDGGVRAGRLPRRQLKLTQKRIAEHREELLQNWSLAAAGKNTFEIEPLK